MLEKLGIEVEYPFDQTCFGQPMANSGLHKFNQTIIFFQGRQMSSHEITFNTNLSEPPRSRADFIYKITPTLISITDTGSGSHSVLDDIEAVLRKMQYWHQGSIADFKITCRDGKGLWSRLQ